MDTRKLKARYGDTVIRSGQVRIQVDQHDSHCPELRMLGARLDTAAGNALMDLGVPGSAEMHWP